MIQNIEWRQRVRQDIEHRLALAHKDLTSIVTILRDAVGAEVWTETPSDSSKTDPTKRSYSLEGWRVHYGTEFQRLNTFHTNHGTALDAYDVALGAALNDYLVSVPVLGSAFNTLLAAPRYLDTDGNLTQHPVMQTHRNALADAIAAELE